jgi:hypothetical protein
LKHWLDCKFFVTILRLFGPNMMVDTLANGSDPQWQTTRRLMMLRYKRRRMEWRQLEHMRWTILLQTPQRQRTQGPAQRAHRLRLTTRLSSPRLPR